jgi:triphosphatase
MATEVELKLTTDPESLARVRQHPALVAVLRGRPRTRKDVSTYYDTRSGELRKAGVALRVRRSGERWLQTVKGAGDRIGAVHRRPEYEWPTRSAHIDSAKLSTTPWRGVFEATAGRLRPVFVTAIDRTEQPLVFVDGTRATLCLDVGEIRSGRRRAPLNEIEIELVEGEPGRLHELAVSLAADFPLSMAQVSKAERGYAMASPSPRKPVRAGRLSFAMDASVGVALASFGGDCLTQIGANARSISCAADGANGEFVHQARVGIRRLRSLLKLIEGLAGPDAVASVAAELQWLSGAFGAARDWDVFAGETLDAVARSLRHPQARRDVGILRGRVTRQRNAHLIDAAAAAASPRLQRLLLALGALFAGLQSAAADPAMRAPARSLAKEMLERRARQLGKRAGRLEGISPSERHRARIAAKKLRYVAAMFAPLFPGARTRNYLASLSKLQGSLGRLNDLATGERLLDELAPRARTERLVHGAGIVRGWLSGAEAPALAGSARAWRKFARAKPFWR